MKKLYFFIALFIMPILSFAYDVEIDGIYYNLNSKLKTAEVTYKDTNYYSYSGIVSIPESFEYDEIEYKVTSIGTHAFTSCSISSIKIPNTITSIGEYAFSFCKKLNKFIIPNNITNIGRSAFIHSELKSVTFSNKLKSTGNCAFAWCNYLEEVNIPYGIITISNECFYDCISLKSISLPNSVKTIQSSAFSGCTKLVDISFSNNITSINYDAFKNCTSLESITLPDSLTILNENSFVNCSHLTRINIHKNIKSIKGGFISCENLKDVYCWADTVPEASEATFSNSFIEYATLHVPKESLQKYASISPWNKFGNIVNLSNDEIPILEQCHKPSIFYNNGKLSFQSKTEDVVFVSDITNSDIKISYEKELDFEVTYNIKVYATKNGMKDSEIATATLCWIDVEPKTEGITSSDVSIKSNPVLIQNNGGNIIINGANDEMISIYNLSGIKVGEGKSINETTQIKTNLKKGNIAIIKIGNKSIKVKLH